MKKLLSLLLCVSMIFGTAMPGVWADNTIEDASIQERSASAKAASDAAIAEQTGYTGEEELLAAFEEFEAQSDLIEPDEKEDGIFDGTIVVDLDEEHFPDKIFRALIWSKWDKNMDASLSSGEISATLTMDASNIFIQDLTGIEYFTSLWNLNCSGNQLTSLDLTANTKLKFLNCSGNKLTSLRLPASTTLIEINASDNQLEMIDTSCAPNLSIYNCSENKLYRVDFYNNASILTLQCNDNALTKVDLSPCTKLQTLSIQNNMITEMDVSKCTALKTIDCSSNRFTALDFSPNANLATLNCSLNYLTDFDASFNRSLLSLDVSNNSLSSIDISLNTSLTTFKCAVNLITSLDLTRNSSLATLDCTGNRLTGLDLTYNTSLTSLTCSNCGLSTIDLSPLKSLTSLDCSSNKLTEINLSNNTALTSLNVSDNMLELLDISGNRLISTVKADANQLTSLDVSAQSGLSSVSVKDNRYEILLDGEKKFDLTTLPGNFSPTNTSSWTNAVQSEEEVNIITVTNPALDITYKYALGGSGGTATFALYVDMNSLIFDANGGICSMYSKALTNSGYFDELPTPTRTGYNFLGWYSSREGGELVTADTKTSEVKARKLYAHWEAATYLVTLDPNEGICSEDSMTVTYDGSWGKFPTPTREGYSFKGWYLPDGTKITAISKVTITADTTAKAGWEADSHTLRFDANGGTCDKKSISVTYDSPYGELPIPTLTGYAFGGWQLPDETKISSETVCKLLEDTTVTATWAPLVFTVTLDPGEEGTCEKDVFTVIYDSPYGEFPAPTRPGYDFAGWFKADDTQIVSTDTVKDTADFTVTAKWTAQQYKLTFNTQGGTCSETERTVTRDEEYGELPEAFMDGYFFLGWYLAPEGGERLHADSLVKATEDYSVYAQWSDVEIPINEDMFPDEAFRNAILELVDTNDNNSISAGEVQATTTLDISGLGIKSLNGIEYLTDIVSLDCSDNSISSLRLAALEDLAELNCSKNALSAVNITSNAKLTKLNCSANSITEIKIEEANSALKELNCSSNALTALDVSVAEALEYLNCSNCGLSQINITANTALTTLRCSGNELGEFAGTASMLILECSGCALETLDVSASTALKALDCSDNKLSVLSLAANTEMLTLDCSGNILACLDLSANTSLTDVTCKNNARIIEANELSGEFDCTQLPGGFNMAMASEWTNATVSGTEIKLTDPSKPATYTYSFGEGRGSGVFTLSLVPFTIKLDAQGGDCEATEITVYAGYSVEICGKLPTAEMTGYTFGGWYTAQTTGTAVNGESIPANIPSDTIYAHWTANQYTVKFNAMDGTANKSQMSVYYGSKYGVLATAEKDGYNFDGWYTAETDGELITGDSTVAFIGEQTLYARWSPKMFTVVFDPNEGENLSEQTRQVGYLTEFGELPTVEKTGYDFAGWYTQSVGGTRIYDNTEYTFTEDIILYAHWEAKKLTVTLNENSGICMTKSITVTYGKTWTGLPTASKSHCDHTGWFTEKEGGVQVKDGDPVTITENITLYAHYAFKQFTVTFDYIGADSGTDTACKMVTYGQTYGTLPEPGKYGHDFGGWWDSADFNGAEILSTTEVKLSADQTIYAKWIPHEYTVTFNPTEGTCEMESMTVYYGRKYCDTMPLPVREGYGFDGWFTKRENGNRITADTVCELTTDQTLYAHWKPKQGMVSFAPNGGTCDVMAREYTYDSTYEKLPTPTRYGFIFLGWYTEKEGGKLITSETVVKTIDNRTLYAHWRGVAGTVFFDPTDGTCPTQSRALEYYDVYGAMPVAENPGYNFLGWYTAEEGGEKIAVWDHAMWEISETVNEYTLFAQWEAATVEITFNANGGTCAVAAMDATFGESIGVLPTPEKDGSNFLGWFTARSGGERISSDETVSVLGDTTIFAHWCIAENTLTIASEALANGGTVWIDGEARTAEEGGIVYLEEGENAKVAVIISEVGDAAADPHSAYPNGMEVWLIEKGEGDKLTARHVPELDNVLQYGGCSIKLTGNKGIRVLSGVPEATRNTLINTGIEGYRLEEYGTTVAWVDELGDEAALINMSYTKSAYAYKTGVSDAISQKANGMIYYTNVLVGFSDEQCAPDLVMKPYMILRNDAGEAITIYGGEIVRSIGYIAYQNRAAFDPGTSAYEYIWHIIHVVYGTEYDSEYTAQ